MENMFSALNTSSHIDLLGQIPKYSSALSMIFNHAYGPSLNPVKNNGHLSLPLEETAAIELSMELMTSTDIYQKPVLECYARNPEYYLNIGLNNPKLYHFNYIRTFPYICIENYQKFLCVALDVQSNGLFESKKAIFDSFSLISKKLLDAFISLADEFYSDHKSYADEVYKNDGNPLDSDLRFVKIKGTEMSSHSPKLIMAMADFLSVYESHNNKNFTQSYSYFTSLTHIRNHSNLFFTYVNNVDITGMQQNSINLKANGFVDCGWLEQAFVDSFVDNNASPFAILSGVLLWTTYYERQEAGSLDDEDDELSRSPKTSAGIPSKVQKFWSKYGTQFIERYGYLNLEWISLFTESNFGSIAGMFLNTKSDLNLVSKSMVFSKESPYLAMINGTKDVFNPHLFLHAYLMNALCVRIENDSNWYLNGAFEEREIKKYSTEAAIKDKRIAELETELAAKQDTVLKLQQENSDLRKTSKSDYYKNVGSLEKDIAKLTIQLEDSKKREDKLLTEACSLSSDKDNIDNTKKATFSIQELAECFKDKKLAVIGGHPRLQKHLLQAFPALILFEGDNDSQPMDCLSTCDYVFMITAHISHSVYFRAMSNIKNTKYAFISGTSPEILGNQMYSFINE